MKKIILLLMSAFILLSAVTANADTDKSMINGKQDYLVMGSVKDIADEDIVITVDHVLGVEASDLVGKDITLSDFLYSYCTYHAPYDFNSPMVSDNVVISIDADGDKYVVKNGAYKVDSNEYSTCKIINHIEENTDECLKGLAEITCFIRSNAKVKKFNYDEKGNIYAVYPQTIEQCVKSVDDDGKAVVSGEHVEENLPEEVVANAAPHTEGTSKNMKRIYVAAIFIIGALLGLLVSYISINRKMPKN